MLSKLISDGVENRFPLLAETKVKAAKGLLAAGTSPREVAQSLGVSVPTLYRWVPASGR